MCLIGKLATGLLKKDRRTLRNSRLGEAEEAEVIWHIGRMKDERLVKTVMLGVVEDD